MVTQKQLDVLAKIENYIRENQKAPTVREISVMTGLTSLSTVHAYLERLKQNGFIDWTKKSARGRTMRLLR